MSAAWEVGDLALCVDVKPKVGETHPDYLRNVNLLHAGVVYRVARVVNGSLRLDGVPLNTCGDHVWGYDPARFHKIQPDAHEPCEAEFATLLKRHSVRA